MEIRDFIWYLLITMILFVPFGLELFYSLYAELESKKKSFFRTVGLFLLHGLFPVLQCYWFF